MKCEGLKFMSHARDLYLAKGAEKDYFSKSIKIQYVFAQNLNSHLTLPTGHCSNLMELSSGAKWKGVKMVDL